MRPHVRRSTRPPAKFLKPYTKVDQDGNVTVPDVKLVKNTTEMGKSTEFVEQLIKQNKITKSSLSTIGRRIAKDYAVIEGKRENDLYYIMTVLIDGEQAIKSLKTNILGSFKKTYYFQKHLGNTHPNVVAGRECVNNLIGFKIPNDVWSMPSIHSAETALKECILSKSIGTGDEKEKYNDWFLAFSNQKK